MTTEHTNDTDIVSSERLNISNVPIAANHAACNYVGAKVGNRQRKDIR